MSVTVHLAIRVAALMFLQATVAAADPVNIDGDPLEIEHMLATEPMKIVSAQVSRPKAQGDITLKAEVAFSDRAPMRVKLRKAMPGADTFNNVPRYDLAAYELQKLLVDPVDFVVPPHRTLAEIEKMAILQTLQRTNWNKQEAAQILGLYRPTLYSKMKKHEIRDPGKAGRTRSLVAVPPLP